MLTQDEKALSFFLTVPQKWRLFWLVNIISISSALGLVGVVYVGHWTAWNNDAESESVLGRLPAWFIFAVNPAAMTFIALCVSRLLQAACDARRSGDRVGKILCKGVSSVATAVRLEPCFYVVLGVWLIVSTLAWWVGYKSKAFPQVVNVSSYTSTSSLESDPFNRHGPEITPNITELVAANLALAAGLVMMAVRSARERARLRRSISGRRQSPSRPHAQDHDDGPARPRQPSRVPALLVGWGLGYWLASMLFILGCSWPNGQWAGAPLAATIVGYILLPLTFFLGVFLVADSNVYGKSAERVLKPIADALGDKTRVLHWAMVVVMRDVTILWMIVISIGVPRLNII